MAQARKTPEPGVDVVVFAADAISMESLKSIMDKKSPVNERALFKLRRTSICVHKL